MTMRVQAESLVAVETVRNQAPRNEQVRGSIPRDGSTLTWAIV
jgi:hypothetical protein